MNTATAADPALLARAAALKMLGAALSGRGGLDEGLSAGPAGRLTPVDRAFARALVMATLRRLGPIDRMLDPRLKREPPPGIRDLLRLGVAQLFYLDVPDFAAVDTTVALAPERLRGLVNAVLRGQLRDGVKPVDPEDLAPAWLFARWRAAYGADAAAAIAAKIAEEPATDLTPRRALDPAMVADLEAQVLPGGSLRTAKRGDIASWSGFADGDWWVQDAAAALPARLLEAAPGQTVLDMCAAPGGKAFQLAAVGARVTALDRSASRLRRVDAGLLRLGLTAEVLTVDAADWADERVFDGVLLDAPCSATGTFRRHPDVLWNVKPGDIAALTGVQSALLTSAARRVAPGGRLVYSVCSLEPEEGEAQVRAFLSSRGDFVVHPISPGEHGAPTESLATNGVLRVLPHHGAPDGIVGGLDGFFIARFRRVKD